MKHGDKAKAKKAKAASKASDKKSSRASASSPARKSSKTESVKSTKSGKAAGPPPAAAKAADGKARLRSSADVSFSNPVVANAFRRAVKKYPNAFRRLTD